MSLRVFHNDSNPAVDPFSYRLSNARAEELVTSGQGRKIQLADGRTAIQLYRNRANPEQWLERLEEANGASRSIAGGYVKWVPPQDLGWLTTQLESTIPNVRAIRRQ